MAFHRLDPDVAGKAGLAPFQIARNPMLTAREKLSLLRRLRAEVAGGLENDHDFGLSPSEVDKAIEEVKQEASNGASHGAGQMKG